MMRKVGMIITVFSVVLSVTTSAQQISIVWQVQDAETQRPVPGAICSVDSIAVGVTDSQGKLIVRYTPRRPQLLLAVRKLGYRSWQSQVTVTGDTLLVPVSLVSQPLLLQNIVISSYRSAREQYEQNLLRFGPRSIDQYLAFLPQISIQRRAAMAGEPLVQGMGMKRYEFRIADVPVLPACTDHMDPANTYIEPEALQNVAVRFAQSGGEFTMVHFIPDSPRMGPKQTMWTGQLSYGSVNREVRAYVRSQYQSPTLGFIIDGTYRRAANYRAGGGELIDPSGFRKWNYRIHGIAQLNPQFRLSGVFIGDDGYDIGFAALPMDTRYDRLRLGNLALQYKPVHQTWLREAVFQVFGSRVDHYMDDWKRPVPVHMDMPGHTRVLGGKLTLHSAIAGVPTKIATEYRSEYVHAEMVMYAPDATPMWMPTWPEMSRSVWSVVGQSYVPIAGWGTFIPHAEISVAQTRLQRADEIAVLQGLVGDFSPERFQYAWSGGIALESNILEAVETSFQLLYQQRLLHQSELYGFYLFQSQDGYDYLGNPRLQPEQRWHASAQVSYNYGSGMLLAAVYGNWFERYVAAQSVDLPPMTIGSHGVKQYRNAGKAWNLGLNLAGWIELLSHFTAGFILKGETGRRSDGMPLPGMAPWTLQMIARYQPENWWIEVQGEIVAANENVARWAGETPDPGYMVWNAEIGWQAFSAVRVMLGCENVFDQQYHRFSDWNDLPAPGRNIYLGIQGRLQFPASLL